MELQAAIFFFLISMITYAFAWRASRRSRVLLPSDVYSVFLLILFGPLILLNLNGETIFTTGTYSDKDAASALWALAVMYVFSSISLFLSKLVLRTPEAFLGLKNIELDRKQIQLATFSLFFLVIIFLGLLPVIENKVDVLRFMSGGMGQEEYAWLRRVGHAEKTNFFTSIISGLRYSLIAFLILIPAILFFRKKRYILGYTYYLFAFVFIASILSKLVFVLFAGYVLLFALIDSRYSRYLTLRYLLLSAPILILSVWFLLALLYTLQYPNIFSLSRPVELLQMSVYRTISLPYIDIIRYMRVYPEYESFTGLSFSSQLSLILDLDFRNVTTEVVHHLLGPAAKTSITTIFVAAAYASGGYLGIAIQSVIVGMTLSSIDYIIFAIKQPILRLACYIIVLINVIFILQVPLPTALFSYGVLLLPLTVLIIDAFASRRSV